MARHLQGRLVGRMEGLGATQPYDQPLTAKRLFGWHLSLFPTGRTGMHRMTVGAYGKRVAEALVPAAQTTPPASV